MKRREFITLLGGLAVAWPFVTSAQENGRLRQIGVLTVRAEGDVESHRRIVAFQQRLKELGWIDGRNARIDYRWAAGNPSSLRKFADELLALAPNVILAGGTPSVAALQQATRTVPIIFVGVTDPVGAGFVESLARPGGNATGFSAFEYGISTKWLEFLKEVQPSVTRAVVIRDPTTTVGVGQFAAMQGVAPSLGVELSPVDLRDAAQIERAVTAFARRPNGGLIVTSSSVLGVYRDLIIALAARNRLPAVYPFRYFAISGGLISYGPDLIDQYRLGASYIDRILKGAKPTDLPVQAATKFELVINNKTAKAIGLTIPESFLARANEVIE